MTRIAKRVALRCLRERLEKEAAWNPKQDPRVLPDMSSDLQGIFGKKPRVQGDEELEPEEYGHSRHIPRSKILK